MFTSILDQTYQDALDALLFFNGNQKKVLDGASLAVEHYGMPRVLASNDRLWVTFDSGIEAQSLFVLEQAEVRPRLIGVVVYTREGDTLAVLFAAIHEDYSSGGCREEEVLFWRILDEVSRISRRIKGITSIRLFLRKPPVTLRVNRKW
ncbi:MAG: hypothetical protein ABSG53_09885 [Thermoguttaceae bacterium]